MLPRGNPSSVSTSRPGGAFRQPRSRIEAEIAAIWQSALEAAPISAEDDFFTLGGDSLAATRLMWQIERSYGVALPLGVLFETPTVAGLANLVAQRAAVQEWEHLVPLQPFGEPLPLFCVHNYNGEVWLYADLARALAPDQPVYGLQAAGVSQPGAPLLSVEDMAERYIGEMRSVQARGPYYVGGICFGAYVALEVARQLVAAGEEVGMIASFDTFAPPAEAVPEHLLGLEMRLRRLSARLNPRKPAELLATVGAIVAERGSRLARNAKLFAYQRGLISRTPAEADARRDLLSALNNRARHAYRPKTYAGKVTLIRCSGSQGKDPQKFCGGVAEQGVKCVEIPGEHVKVLDRENVAYLADALRGCLRGRWDATAT